MILSKKEKKYIDVSIPKELISEVDKMIGQYGYRSRPELVKDAIRSLLRQYGLLSKAIENEEKTE